MKQRRLKIKLMLVVEETSGGIFGETILDEAVLRTVAADPGMMIELRTMQSTWQRLKELCEEQTKGGRDGEQRSQG